MIALTLQERNQAVLDEANLTWAQKLALTELRKDMAFRRVIKREYQRDGELLGIPDDPHQPDLFTQE